MNEAQDLFNQIVSHLRKQNAVSKRKYCKTGIKDNIFDCNSSCVHEESNFMCTYRGPNNLKCAVGCLIPDELYSPELEGDFSTLLKTLRKIGHSNSIQLADLLGKHWGMLTSLQSIHDCFDIKNWEESFEGIAISYNLEYLPPVKD